MDLLMRSTGWSFKEACQRVEQHLGIAAPPAPAKPRPQPPTQGAEKAWAYSETFLVCRFPGKRIRPLSWDGEQWRWAAPKAPRPLLYLDQLLARPGDPVIVAEGEKAADAAAFLFPTHVATTWPSGCKAIGKADWKPLTGRLVVLWPDADEVGIQAMEALAQILLKVGATVSIVTPPPDVPQGWDLADATWTQEEALAYLEEHAVAVPGVAQQQPPPEHKGNQPFVCLGFDADGFFYQPASTGQVVRISGASHTGLNLCRLAPLPYWEALYPSKTGINWTAAGSDLFEAQARVGMFNPDTLRGRGVWWDQGRPILHLGDRLLVNGIEQPITGVPGSRAHYQRGRALEGPGDASPLTDAEAHQLLAIAEEFQWDVPASSLLLAGWVVLGPICGSLSWRPHIWLTAGAGTGKSTILGRYVTPLLGDIGLIVVGNTSEAGIRQDLRCDALPVVFDESESNERQDQQRIQSVLALARIASSESKGAVLKGSSGGEVTRYRMRSMFMMCSITTALKQGADRRRFAQLTLRAKAGQSDADREAHWKQLEKMLDDTVTEETARRLLARSVSLIPVIHQSAKVFVRVAARHFGSQALGDQYGTLLAGAWSLMSAEPVTEEQAQTLISQNNWSSYQENVEQPDEERCLQRILQHQLRVEGPERTETRNIRELVDLVASPGADMLSSISPAQAEKVLGRHGIRVDDGRLLVSNTAEALARILQDSAWACSWSTILTRLPGAEKVGSTRFSGVGVTRAVAVPIDQL
jgi:putative DNA primase/helicase